jgi:hypothetical protein
MKWQTVKTGLWSAAGGAVVWWIMLSAVFGWMPAGRAEKQASVQAEAAVLDVLAPICVAQFKADGNREQKLAALQQANSWARDTFIIKHGWATMPGAVQPRAGVAVECANRILATSRL